MFSDDMTGIVLAGGSSSRLGQDKAELVLDDSGLSLLAATVRLLQGLVPRVLVSGRERAGFSCLPDDAPGCGPVGAVTTALRRTGTACLVLPCDMPFMDAATLRLLLEARNSPAPDRLATLFVHAGNGKTEHLVAIYEPEALRFLAPSLEARLLKIALVLPRERCRLVPAPERAARTFFNINSPADLRLARKLCPGIHS